MSFNLITGTCMLTNKNRFYLSSFGRRAGVADFFLLFLSDLTSFTFLSFDHGVFDGESSGCCCSSFAFDGVRSSPTASTRSSSRSSCS